MTEIRLKRAYDGAANSDGPRLLVDRVWPRGVSKEDANLSHWLKELAPSTDLRKWFDHDPDKWSEFQKRYLEELKNNESDDVKQLGKRIKWLILPLHESETDRHLIGLSG